MRSSVCTSGYFKKGFRMYEETDGFLVKVVLIGSIGLMLFFPIRGCIRDFDRDQMIEQKWADEHNTTKTELETFAKIMNVSAIDVINSPGLQKEFQRFEDGDLRQVGQETHREGKHTVTTNVFQ